MDLIEGIKTLCPWCHISKFRRLLWEMDLIEGIKTTGADEHFNIESTPGLWEMDLIEGIKTQWRLTAHLQAAA